MPAELVTIPGVPILETGDYLLSTGPVTFTEEDLRAAVAALSDPAVKVPRIKIDGLADSFEPGAHGGEPAFGRATNLTVSDDGQTLFADLEVPDWLAATVDWAYPSRSIEGAQAVQTTTGNRHDLVITAVALLGVDLPGVSTLEDIGELLANGPDIAAASEAAQLVAASTGGRTARVVAGLDQDLVRRRFYEFIESEDAELPEGTTAWDMWVRSMRFDDSGTPYLKVEDDASGRLYRVDFTVSGSEVTFAAFAEVVEQDVPVAASGRGPVTTLARWSDRQESRRAVAATTPGGTTPMTPEQIRALAISLGLDPETATEQQVHEAAAARAAAEAQPGEGDTPPAEQTEGGEGDGGASPAPETTETGGEPSGATATGEPAAVAASGTLTLPVSRAQWDAQQRELAELRATVGGMTEAQTREHRDGVIAAAVGDGRIAPSERETWRTELDNAPEATERLLASMPANRVPVHERGVQPSLEAGATPDAEHEAYMARHFPQAAAARERRSAVTTRTEV
jgi:hypothetical protein